MPRHTGPPGRRSSLPPDVGATGDRVHDGRSRTEGAEQLLHPGLRTVDELDLDEAVMDLELDRVACEAALEALGETLPGSLVSFLR